GAIRALMDLAPTRVLKQDESGRTVEVDVAELAVGDRFLVRPGDAVATDGQVVDGTSAVNEAAVTGEPDPDLGERVVAWIVPAPGRSPTAADLTAQAASQLARHKQPREFRFLDQLPRNDLGKVQKARLSAE
ncbi:MAG: hypothetical protein J0H06_11280, partial [Actinobacteria bacterium]|nr:hypothetical protein [Actinomycetota bacterium]